MRQILSAGISIAFFFVLLCFPKETVSGATSGLLLWFQIVLPTLLPYLIATNLLIQTNSISYISRFSGPFLQRIFRVSPDGSFAILAGFLCGYPIGAKVSADLVRSHRISEKEGNYLLSFCNNTSPAFLTSYLVLQNLKEEALLLPTLLILFLSPILCSFFFRRFYFTKTEAATLSHTSASLGDSHLCFSFDIFDTSMMNAFISITKVGGYILLFSIVLSLGKALPFAPFLAILEVTNGIPLILRTVQNSDIAYILTLTLTSFGGICTLAQTRAMLSGTRLSISAHTIEKLITALVTSLLALLFIRL